MIFQKLDGEKTSQSVLELIGHINRIPIMDLRRLGDIALYLLWPPFCAHCRKTLDWGDDLPLCPKCRLGLRLCEPPYCTRCADPCPGLRSSFCPSCARGGFSLRMIRSAFLYKDSAVSLIHGFKYRGRKSAALRAGEWMGRLWGRFPELCGADALVPVPLHPRKLRERGYNQSRFLAEGLSQKIGLPVLDCLTRIRATRKQCDLSRTMRFQNTAGAFSAKKEADPRGLRILLIDDVCTTGASLEACALALKDAGVLRVDAYAFAREALSRVNGSI